MIRHWRHWARSLKEPRNIGFSRISEVFFILECYSVLISRKFLKNSVGEKTESYHIVETKSQHFTHCAPFTTHCGKYAKLLPY